MAIDFETANEQRRSACAVGLVRFDSDGAVVDTYYSLIRPHPEVDYFNPVNTWVHGLTERDVEDAPAWDQIAGRVHDFVGADPIVAHNMAFDGYVLSDLANLYNTRPIDNRRFCTLRLARSILATELERKKLSHVYDYYFPGETFEHHNATADAEACGRIFARMQRDHSYEKLEEICPATPASRATRR